MHDGLVEAIAVLVRDVRATEVSCYGVDMRDK